MTIAYVDADILCHRAIHGAATEMDEGEFLVSHRGIKDSLVEQMAAWTAPIKATTVIPVLSDYHHNWRYALGGPYKLNRSSSSADLMQFARAFVREHWPNFIEIEGLEADDTIGIAVTHPDHAARSVAVSIDKDFLTLPGRVFNPSHGGRRALKVTKPQADWNWMMQALTGDTVDNYKGVPGIGPKKAEKILEGTMGDVWAMWGKVVEAYLAADLRYEDALLNTRYARILRHEDWSEEKGVRLFTGNKRQVEWLAIDTEIMKRPTGETNEQSDEGTGKDVPRKVQPSDQRKAGRKRPRRKATKNPPAA